MWNLREVSSWYDYNFLFLNRLDLHKFLILGTQMICVCQIYYKNSIIFVWILHETIESAGLKKPTYESCLNLIENCLPEQRAAV